jgi:hypothetical protein
MVVLDDVIELECCGVVLIPVWWAMQLAHG